MNNHHKNRLVKIKYFKHPYLWGGHLSPAHIPYCGRGEDRPLKTRDVKRIINIKTDKYCVIPGTGWCMCH